MFGSGGIHLMCHSLLQLQATDVCRPSNTFGLPQYISIRTLLSFPFLTILSSSFLDLSSPRAKLTGSKGLRAESARAFTGRRNSHSGRGEDLTASASMQQGHRKCDLYLDYEHISRLWEGGGGRQELGWSSTCR